MSSRRPPSNGFPLFRAIGFLLAPLLLFLAVITPSAVHADGWIEIHRPHPPRPPHPPIRPVPTPRMEVTRHHVDVSLDRGIASVIVDETFHNPHGRDLEGTYYFPVPSGAQIEDFRAVLGGKELAGEILPAAEAREIYENLVRQVVDPAILEYYRRDLFRARIFPIPARGDVSLTIRYRHRVPANGGLLRFRYPLDTGRFAAGDYRDVKIQVDVVTDGNLHAVASPSHPLTELQRSARHSKLIYTADRLAARHDFLLDVVEGNGDLAGGVRAFRESHEDGWFVLRLVPGKLDTTELPPTTLVLVVDTSGSMAGEKLVEAKEALRSACARLRPEDRFQILGFSSRVHSFAPEPVAATLENLDRARTFIEGLIARGGTNIDEALATGLAAAKAEDGGSTVLLITDGAPTVGVTDPLEITRRATVGNGGDHRIHVLGVGAQVNTRLLDRLARENRGSRTYLRGTELEVALGSLLDRVLYPSISDLKLVVDGVTIDRLEPQGPWDLFHGDDLVIAGRYQGSGPAHVRVEGLRGSEQRAWTFPATFPAHGGEDEASYLWAELRIVRLLEELRDRPRESAKLREELVALSLRYGIVTPYTSYLIREAPSGMISRRLGRVVDVSPELKDLAEKQAAGFERDQGDDAFDYARGAAEQRRRAGSGGDAAGLSSAPESESIDRRVGLSKRRGKTFHPLGDADGTIFDADLGDLEQVPEPDLVLDYLSPEYLAFLRDNPGVEKILARGRSIFFRWGGQIVRVKDAGPQPVVAPKDAEGPAPAPKKKTYF